MCDGRMAALICWGLREVSAVRKLGVARSSSSGSPEVFDVSGAGDTVIATLAVMLASGATTEQIAANLALSPISVRAHLKLLYDKLGVASREGRR